jgi:large subunit ribosomal protein L4
VAADEIMSNGEEQTVEGIVAEPTTADAAAPKPKPRARKKSVATAAAESGPKASVVDGTGKRIDSIPLDEARFGVPANINSLHLAVRADQAARRRGTASTKTRGEISGSTAKMYRQKGTGRARAGSIKSPVRVGGGTVFGPKPRRYDIKVNRKVARKALAMALSTRAEDGNVFVARDLQLAEPSTATINRMLIAMDIPAPVLLITSEEPIIARSTRNLAFAVTVELTKLTTEQVLRARSLVFTEKAFAALDQA